MTLVVGAGFATASLALASVSLLHHGRPPVASPVSLTHELEQARWTPDVASRGGARGAPLPPLSAFLPANRPKPVGGLSQAQTDNADVIVLVGKALNLPRNAYIVAIVTALQESNLNNLANPSVPTSLKYPYQGTDSNYDSVGLFQQRPSQGWGSVAQLMDPRVSAHRFYSALVKVPGWQTMSASDAAQAVQRSAFPAAYGKHESLAKQVVDALA
jgi:hypothetical protein